MTKIVYNGCFGGFSISAAAVKRYAELIGKEISVYPDLPRHDPVLVQVVEELGEAANGRQADLRIANVPAGSKYRIDAYDGNESVMTPDDYYWSIAP